MQLTASGFIVISGFFEMPEASTSNIHGPIHGKVLVCLVNAGGVEGNLTPYKSFFNPLRG